MYKDIKEKLGIEDKTIENLWNENSPYILGEPFLKAPRTKKTMAKFEESFEFLID